MDNWYNHNLFECDNGERNERRRPSSAQPPRPELSQRPSRWTAFRRTSQSTQQFGPSRHTGLQSRAIPQSNTPQNQYAGPSRFTGTQQTKDSDLKSTKAISFGPPPANYKQTLGNSATTAARPGYPHRCGFRIDTQNGQRYFRARLCRCTEPQNHNFAFERNFGHSYVSITNVPITWEQMCDAMLDLSGKENLSLEECHELFPKVLCGSDARKIQRFIQETKSRAQSGVQIYLAGYSKQVGGGGAGDRAGGLIGPKGVEEPKGFIPNAEMMRKNGCTPPW
jgi:hypothetical protein